MSNRRPVNKVTPSRRPKVAGTTRSAPRVERAVPETPSAKDGPPAEASKPSRASIAERLEPAGKARRLRAIVSTGLRPRRGSWALAGLLVIVAVLLSAFAVVAALRPGARPANAAFVDTERTQEVRAAAEHALKQLNEYKADRMGGYKDAVRGVLTDTMYAEFAKAADVTIAAAEQSKTDTKVDVDPIGVTLLDGDRAELLVYVTVSAERDGKAASSGRDAKVLRMDKVGGRWLLSDIPDEG